MCTGHKILDTWIAIATFRRKALPRGGAPMVMGGPYLEMSMLRFN
jgi:hypothetical protein